MSFKSKPTKFFRFQWVSTGFTAVETVSIDWAKAVMDNKIKAIKENRMRKSLGIQRNLEAKSVWQNSAICVIIEKDLQFFCIHISIML